MQHFKLLACNTNGLFAIYKSIALQNDLFSNKFFFRLDDYQIADVAFALFVRTQNNKKRGKQDHCLKRSVKLAFQARSNSHNA